MVEKLGPYEIECILGRGGMGTVFAGVHEETGVRAAVKVLSSVFASEDTFRGRFSAEIETLKKLRHPNIVQLLGYGVEDGRLFYSMQLVNGVNLEEEMQAGRKFTWQDVVSIGVDVCKALKHAHDRGVVHRDLKPANLLRGEDGRIMLADFGIAKLFGGAGFTAAGGVIGTADFMSPEQARGLTVNARSDLYSLGSVFFCLLAGRPPFTGKSLPEVIHAVQYDKPVRIGRLAPGIPPALEEIIDELLTKDPQDRIPTAIALSHRLQAMGHGVKREEAMSEEALHAATRIAQPEDDAYELAPPDSASTTPPTGKIISPSEQLTVPPTLAGATPNQQTASAATSDFTPDGATQASVSDSEYELSQEGSHFTHVDKEELGLFESAMISKAPSGALAIAKIALMAVGVAMIGGLVWWSMQPVSADALAGRIEQAVENGEVISVQTEIETFLRQYPDDARCEQMENRQENIKTERMQIRLDRKARRPKGVELLSPAESCYLDAIRIAPSDPQAAMAKLQALVDVFGNDISGNDAEANRQTRQCAELAKRRIVNLQAVLKKIESEHLPALVARLDQADALMNDDPRAAMKIYRGVVNLYQNKAWAQELVSRAQAALEKQPSNE